MSLGELAERFDAYCWGENNLKRVHVIQTADELQTIL
jgi:hypothetical protein